jgi:hypothetical protein
VSWLRTVFVFVVLLSVGCGERPTVLDGQLSAPFRRLHISIDIASNDWATLEDARNRALSEGRMRPENKVKVRAYVSDGVRRVEARVRLKGDLTDHIDHATKWSLRVKLKKGSALFGMRRFSIQRPETRGFQFEPIFLALLRARDVLAPQYRFAEVHYNGTSIGLMAVEEHFSRELVEAQGRRESVIVRLNENHAWFNPGEDGGFRRDGPFDQFRNAPVRVFQRGRTRRSKALRALYKVAVGLLRGVTTGTLAPSAAFEAEPTGRFLAVSELFGTHHGVAWHQQRFYLNPITLKLEPLAFDNAPGVSDHELLRAQEPLVDLLLSDPIVMKAYKSTLYTLIAAWEAGSLQTEIRQYDDDYRAQLQQEFPRLPPLNFDQVQQRIKALGEAELHARRPPPVTNTERPERYPVACFAYLVGKGRLELRSAVPYEVRISGGRWVPREGDGPTIDLPVTATLKPLSIGGTPQSVVLPNVVRRKQYRLLLNATVAGDSRPYEVQVRRSVLPLTSHPLAPSDIKMIAEIEGVERTDDGLVISGDVVLTHSILLPPGLSLTVQPGATIRLVEGVTLLCRGQVTMVGTAAAPIRIIPKDTSFAGLVVASPGPHRFEHVTFRGTTGARHGKWALTGGVTVYNATASTFRACRFEDAHGEDALNIVNSHFELHDVVMERTRSDAFDADFSTGLVQNARFVSVGLAGGGDAIDISGGHVTVRTAHFENIGDKALSAGEGGRLDASDIVVHQAAAGAVSKDRSIVTLDNAKLAAIGVAGLMAYTKKQAFGPARLIATGIQYTGVPPLALVQIGSTLTIEEKPVAPAPLDVDALYKTVMKRAR